MLGRKRDNEIAMSEGRNIWRQEQAAIGHAREQLEGPLDVGGVFDQGRYEFDRK